jgi:hypothetical protein
MGFKIKAPYEIDNTPVYLTKETEEVLGRANKAGSINLNCEVTDPKLIKKVCDHEKIHLDQIDRGDLTYTDDAVIWKGKEYSRSEMKEGAKNLPWEAEAYRNETT